VPGRHNSAVAASAYQSGRKLRDERNGQVQDYSRKRGVVMSTVLTPEGAPEWMGDPERLWNAVEFREDESNRHESAQLARSLDVALPVELTREENKALALAIGGEFVARGMVAQISVHDEEPKAGQVRNPHCHILLTMREVTPEGFGKKNREWNGGWMKEGAPDGGVLSGWRRMIAEHTNTALQSAGQDARIDARSYRDRGIDQVAGVHQGKEATALRRRGIATRRGSRQKVVAVHNAARRSDAVVAREEGGEARRRAERENPQPPPPAVHPSVRRDAEPER
jgi:hypothetical protein